MACVWAPAVSLAVLSTPSCGEPLSTSLQDGPCSLSVGQPSWTHTESCHHITGPAHSLWWTFPSSVHSCSLCRLTQPRAEDSMKTLIMPDFVPSAPATPSKLRLTLSDTHKAMLLVLIPLIGHIPCLRFWLRFQILVSLLSHLWPYTLKNFLI